MDTLQRIRAMESKRRTESAARRRAVWAAIQEHLPKLAEDMPRIHAVLGPMSAIVVESGEQRWEWSK